MYNIPILFIIFSRPDTTKRVFDRIRDIKPKRLYIAADAAREDRPDEIKRCEEVRTLIHINWDCEVKTLYQTKNIGCQRGPFEAISWFFKNEEYGIILEDDCLPDLSFFPYCEELLIKYKDDNRVGHIGGNNFFSNIVSSDLSYDFCNMPHAWGWASWRRVWNNYDLSFSYWEKSCLNRTMRKSIFTSKLDEIYFSTFISDTLAGNKGITAWDTQYLFMLRAQNQLAIYPSVNLVTNIGLNSIGATHISWKNKRLYIASQSLAFPLKHPEYILANKEIDEKTIRRNYFSIKRFIRYYFNLY